MVLDFVDSLLCIFWNDHLISPLKSICDILNWLICWTILVPLKWNLLDHEERSFYVFFKFGQQILCLEFSHLCPQGRSVCNLFLLQYWLYKNNLVVCLSFLMYKIISEALMLILLCGRIHQWINQPEPGIINLKFFSTL